MEKKNIEHHQAREANTSKFLSFVNHHYFLLGAIIFIVALLIGGIAVIENNNSRIYVDKATIYTPLITLSPASPGVLDRVFVKEGDGVTENMVVAEVDGIPIKTKTSGLVTFVQNSPGQFVTSATPVVQMVDPEDYRLVGQVEEDKGLADIKTGQTVVFTVDAFGSKKYYGNVDSVSPTSRQSDIVFSISDTRAENEFNVYVKFDSKKYPELKNGMSARMWIYK